MQCYCNLLQFYFGPYNPFHVFVTPNLVQQIFKVQLNYFRAAQQDKIYFSRIIVNLR